MSTTLVALSALSRPFRMLSLRALIALVQNASEAEIASQSYFTDFNIGNTYSLSKLQTVAVPVSVRVV